MYHVGINHVGLAGGGTSSCSSVFSCCAVLKMPTPKYSVHGVFVFLSEAYLPIEGRVFSPSVRWPIVVRGVSILRFGHLTGVCGTLTRAYNGFLAVVGDKAPIPFANRLPVKGIKRETAHRGYSVEAVTNLLYSDWLRVRGVAVSRGINLAVTKGFLIAVKKLSLKVTGDKAGSVIRFLRVRGGLQKASKSLYKAKGSLAKLLRSAFLVKVKAQGASSTIIKVRAKLFSKVYSNLFRLQGFVPKLAFIAAVPRRFQDFVTNKRWFR